MLILTRNKPKIRTILITIFLVILSLVLISNFFVGPMLVRGSSMEPTIKNGQWVIVGHTKYTLFKDYKRNDIVLHSKFVPTIPRLGRILGVPGDKLLVKNNILYINDNAYNFPGLNTENLKCLQEEKKLNDGYWFVIEDNPSFQINSCSFGLVHSTQLEGVVLYKLPF